MCTSIVELTKADGMAKNGTDWFPVTHAAVAYDHARHAIAGDVITIDFVNEAIGPSARAGVELTLESAKALVAALTKAIAEADEEEAERAESIAAIVQHPSAARAAARATMRDYLEPKVAEPKVAAIAVRPR